MQGDGKVCQVGEFVKSGETRGGAEMHLQWVHKVRWAVAYVSALPV